MATAPNIASTGIVLEALTKDNYENWSTLVESYLVGQGLWDVVESDAKPDLNDDQWKRKNGKALHAIQLSCGSENLTNIRKFKKAREAWNHLKASFSEDVKAEPDNDHGVDHQFIYQLHRDVKRGYWNDAKSYINRNPDAVFYSSPAMGRTVLHVAVAAGQEKIVKKLVKIGNEQLLKRQDKRGYTALALAAELTDNAEMAKWMVDKGGKDLLTIKTKDLDDGKGVIPVLLASAKGHKNMTSYLYSQTPWGVLLENQGHYGVVLLSHCISAEIFDVAAALLQAPHSRELPLSHKSDCLQPIYALAHMPSAFPSGTQLGWLQNIVYNILKRQNDKDPIERTVLRQQNDKDPVERSIEIISIVDSYEAPAEDRHTSTGRFFGLFQRLAQTSILLKFSGIKQIHEMKMKYLRVHNILKCMRKRITRLLESELRECSVYDAMLQAAKYGIIEFIDSMMANPDLLWAMDTNKRGIFSHAILNRQEKVFKLIHGMKGQKEMIASREDVFGNNMLHLAAELGPSSYLDRIPNAALQMQRELQWFEAVKRIVPLKCNEARNADGKKPRELFTKTHEELVKAGEKWAKDTSSSFALVGTLIITIMFAAAFTVPGGNQDTGMPIFLGKPAFTFFIIADTLSLVTSSSSVLTFIGILTSRFAEEDYLISLPLKLLFGLFTLFLSVAFMMCAFCAALAMMLKGYHRVVIAAILLSIIPVLVLVPSLLSLFFVIFKSIWRSDLLASQKKKS